MTEEQRAMMLQLQQYSLTMTDLALYLDTHPADDFALQRFEMTATAYHDLMAAYAGQFGPLIPWQKSGEQWMWTEQPFPWTLD